MEQVVKQLNLQAQLAARSQDWPKVKLLCDQVLAIDTENQTAGTLLQTAQRQIRYRSNAFGGVRNEANYAITVAPMYQRLNELEQIIEREKISPWVSYPLVFAPLLIGIPAAVIAAATGGGLAGVAVLFTSIAAWFAWNVFLLAVLIFLRLVGWKSEYVSAFKERRYLRKQLKREERHRYQQRRA